MALTNRGLLSVSEDWAIDRISTASADGIMWINSSDAGNTAFARSVAVSGTLVARAATDTTDDDMCEIAHDLLGWSAINGVCGMQTRVRCTNIADVAFTIGFNDDQLEDSNTLPVELAGTTFTTNASTFVGFVYDADATNKEPHVMWVNGDADASDPIATLRSGVTLGSSQWFTVSVVMYYRDSNTNGVRVELDFFNETTGAHFNKAYNTTVVPTTLLTPHIAFENRSGTNTHTFDIGYIDVWMARP